MIEIPLIAAVNSWKQKSAFLAFPLLCVIPLFLWLCNCRNGLCFLCVVCQWRALFFFLPPSWKSSLCEWHPALNNLAVSSIYNHTGPWSRPFYNLMMKATDGNCGPPCSAVGFFFLYWWWDMLRKPARTWTRRPVDGGGQAASWTRCILDLVSRFVDLNSPWQSVDITVGL